jgi:hypothetical protein
MLLFITTFKVKSKIFYLTTRKDSCGSGEEFELLKSELLKNNKL